jgi:hypothetical protein
MSKKRREEKRERERETILTKEDGEVAPDRTLSSDLEGDGEGDDREGEEVGEGCPCCRPDVRLTFR